MSAKEIQRYRDIVSEEEIQRCGVKVGDIQKDKCQSKSKRNTEIERHSECRRDTKIQRQCGRDTKIEIHSERYKKIERQSKCKRNTKIQIHSE